MKIVRVQYTTREEYAATNQENIRLLVEELASLQHPGIRYGAYLLPDGKTFMHFDQFDTEEDHKKLTALDSFKKFSEELLASGLEIEPELDLLSIVGRSKNLF